MSSYEKLAKGAGAYDAATVVLHTLDSLGFRFHWATEGIEDGDLDFAPTEDAMSLGKQLAHVRRLLQWTDLSLQNIAENVEESIGTAEEMRADTFTALDSMKARVAEMGAEGLAEVECFGLPFWNLLGGPILDCFTHVGQISTYRRMQGKPLPRINYFSGQVKR